MMAASVRAPVYVMPLGVNERVYNGSVKPMTLPASVRRFKFVSVFWWSVRKGYDLLLRAYFREFSGDDDVSLVIVTKRHDGKGLDSIKAEIDAIKVSMTEPKGGFPHLSVNMSNMSEGELASLYRACDAFVLPSRGEGFGLPYLESAACGLPVIATNCTAMSTYLDPSTALLVEPEGYEISPAAGGKLAKWCRFYENQYFPRFGERSISQLRSHMRTVLADRHGTRKMAARLQHKVLSGMRWKDAANRIIERLKEIQS
jgi:glycosyltransferase involved in cell wall biosynthesis